MNITEQYRTNISPMLMFAACHHRNQQDLLFSDIKVLQCIEALLPELPLVSLPAVFLELAGVL